MQGTQYVYDAGGARIAKGTLSTAPATGATCAALSASGGILTSGYGFTISSRYLVDLGGDQVTELNASGQWTHSNVWAGGKLTATYDTKGIHFELTDPLGTKRVQVNAAGQVDETCTSLPFGNDIGNQPGVNCSGVANSLSTNDDATEHHFTGKERDTESGNDYFGARYYASSMGRWMSPDKPFADQHASNPQSWNLYSYVRNNPLISIDDNGQVTIEIRYNQLGPGYTHSFIVVTDRDGTKTVFRAGPSNQPSSLWITPATGGAASQTSGSQSSGSDSSNSSSPGGGPTGNGDPWGQLQAVHGDFVPGGPDYDQNQENPAGSSTLLSNDQPAGDYINTLLQYEGSVNQANIPYNPLTTSSNAYATGAANALGLTVPKPPEAAPGSGTKLPVTPPPPTPPPPPPPPFSVAGACK